MSEWRESVVGELTELTEKMVRLRRFMVTEAYFELPGEQASLLRRQSIIMHDYADVLIERLESSG
jgi:hypothetical protein